MNQARFYLLAIALHAAVLLWLSSPGAQTIPEPKEHYVEVVLETVPAPLPAQPELPALLQEPETVSSTPANQAGQQMIEQSLVEDEPPPSLHPDLPPPEPPPPATPETAEPARDQFSEVKAPPDSVPSPTGSKAKNPPGPVPKATSTENGAPNGNGTNKAGALRFGGNFKPLAQLGGHYYEAISVPSGITWLDAQKFAISHGGYLATITSAAENKLVFSLIKDPQYWGMGGNQNAKKEGPWIGGFKNPVDNREWQWVNDEGLLQRTSFRAPWALKEPDNDGGNQDRLHFYNQQAVWDDQSGRDLMLGFVVEYDSDPSMLPYNPDAGNAFHEPKPRIITNRTGRAPPSPSHNN